VKPLGATTTAKLFPSAPVENEPELVVVVVDPSTIELLLLGVPEAIYHNFRVITVDLIAGDQNRSGISRSSGYRCGHCGLRALGPNGGNQRQLQKKRATLAQQKFCPCDEMSAKRWPRVRDAHSG
jgi:hypothetical protein